MHSKSIYTGQEICSPNKSSSTRVARKTQVKQCKAMQMELSPSTLLEHRPGAINLNADALSRNPATALLQEKGKEV